MLRGWFSKWGAVRATAVAAALLPLPGCTPEPEVGPTAGEEPQEIPAAGEAAWRTDFAAALREAERAEKPLLLFFYGSDWCLPCVEWGQRILEAEEFREYAAQELILVALDFPLQGQQSLERVHQNRALQSRYEVELFPTMLLIGPDREEIDRMSGVMPSRPRDFVAWLEMSREESFGGAAGE